LPFAWRADCPALTAFDAATKINTLVEDAAKHLKETYNADLALIVIDTLVAAAGYARPGDENDAAMGQKVMSVMAELSKITGALTAGIDHFGKVVETGTRGTSAKEAAADAILALLADRALSGAVSNCRLAVRKIREGQPGVEIPFTPKTVEVGTDSDGDPETRVVIDWTAPVQSPDKKWSKSLELLRRILMAILANCGEDVCPFADGPMLRACRLDLVKTEFLKQYPTDKPDTARKAFDRAIRDAQAASLIGVRKVAEVQFLWLTRLEPAT
jgi:hypothetical protein